MICSGEALPAELRDRVSKYLSQVQLENLYGPTEAAIDVTRWSCAGDSSREVPIGRPIWNTRAYVLDGGLEPVPAVLNQMNQTPVETVCSLATTAA